MSLVQLFDTELSLALAALASKDVILQNGKIDGSRSQGFRIVNTKIWMEMEGKTVDEGPIQLGISCNAGAAEVEALMEADPQAPSDDDSRGIGVFVKTLFQVGKKELTIPAAASGRHLMAEISYGKNGWSIPEDQPWSVWAFNAGTGALTTGTVFRIFAEHFGVWLRD